MHRVHLSECVEFLAGDSTILRELLHPDKADLQLRYSLAHAIVRPGDTSLRHSLKTSEVYYLLSGIGEMHMDEETEMVTAGTVIYIPPGTIQFIHNPGPDDLVFLCIVDPAWRKEDEVVL